MILVAWIRITFCSRVQSLRCEIHREKICEKNEALLGTMIILDRLSKVHARTYSSRASLRFNPVTINDAISNERCKVKYNPRDALKG